MTPGQLRRQNLARFIDERHAGNKCEFADHVGAKRAQIYRYFAKSVKGQEPGENFTRRVETVSGLPRGYFVRDLDEPNDGSLDRLVERFSRSPPAVQALIQLALDDPNTPISEVERPSLKVMLEIVRSQIQAHLPK